MKDKKPQKQKNIKGVKTAFIWEELDEKYGIFDNREVVA